MNRDKFEMPEQTQAAVAVSVVMTDAIPANKDTKVAEGKTEKALPIRKRETRKQARTLKQ